jgi:hypothetical protein
MTLLFILGAWCAASLPAALAFAAWVRAGRQRAASRGAAPAISGKAATGSESLARHEVC